MPRQIHLLLVEDSDDDAELLLLELKRGGFDTRFTRVDNREDMRAALQNDHWDIIISDYSMPNFDGIAALHEVKEIGLDVPFLIVSANIGEEVAVMAMKAGAHDYIMKGNLKRLIPAIERELKESEVRRIHKLAEEQMRKLSSAIEQSADSVIITDPEGSIEYVNPAFEKITGYDRNEVLGKTTAILRSGNHDNAFYRQMWTDILDGQSFHEVFVNRRKDGSLYYEQKTITPLKDDRGDISFFISTGKDITEQMDTRKRLHYVTSHDVLTGLPNRSLYIDRLTQAISRARWNNRVVAVLFLDLDRFKHINETLGYDAGDYFLKVVADRLSHCVRDGDTVARLGDDEFAIILEDLNHENDIPQQVNKIFQSMEEPLEFDGHELFITLSIGVSLYPNDGEDATTLIQCADISIHRAKEGGTSNYQFYSNDLSSKTVDTLMMESDLRRALERNEFILHYQPQLSLESGDITGVEALIRWQHPELGLIPPVKFIPLLEETGMIVDAGEWVLREACRQCAVWLKEYNERIRMSVNISAVQFGNIELIDTVRNVLNETGLPASLLEMEITESTVMHSPQNAISILQEFNNMGIRLSIDDFGTGYSSLSYLSRFPLTTLKIDRSFVSQMLEQRQHAAIVTSIISLAHNLDLNVIAEGVEQDEQRQFLLEHHCNEMQGFLFSPPVSAENLTVMLKEYRKTA
jgi:diguanylate cyclase (GGDEF)-like protein/PAS domain S-box-containing protein